MDLNGIVNRSQRNNSASVDGINGVDVKGVKNKSNGIISSGIPSSNPDAVLEVKNDWKIKIKIIDTEISDLQETITLNQYKQDNLVGIQNELLDYPQKDVKTIAGTVNFLIDQSTFNGRNVMDEYKMDENTAVHSFSARIEEEKGRLSDEIQTMTHELKSRLISKENLILVSNNIDRQQLNMEMLEDIKKFLSEFNENAKLDNEHLKGLL